MQQQRAAAGAVFKEYLAAICQLPQIFRRTAFRRRTCDEELQEALLRGNLRKELTGIDLWLLGMGIVIGSSWALLTGIVAQQFAGAAIIISYLFSGLAMLLAACCFAELCVEFPVSGGAFSYVMINFGEFPAFFTLGGLMLEYALGMAAIARGFSRFVARLCNVSPSLFLVELWQCPPGFTVNAADVVTTPRGFKVPAIGICTVAHSFDFMAAAIVMIITGLLSLGVQRSTLFISSLTIVKIVLLVFISIVGYTQAGPSCIDTTAPCCNTASGCGLQDAEARYCNVTTNTFAQHCNALNLTSSTDPFWDPDFSIDGLFLGAAALFFTYNGLDAICNAAEEAKDVAHLPWALVGTVGASTVLYVMLAVAMVYLGLPNVAKPMLPPDEPYLTFASAFNSLQGMVWMQCIVAVAALIGIVTTLTVGLYSLSRVVMAASRDWLLPPFLARISPRTHTPLVAQLVFGVIIALLAMLVEVDAATSLVAFGTLVTLWMVCNVQLFRRYYPEVQMRFTRYGTVEVATLSQVQSWVPGKNLALQTRKVLVAVHLVSINLVGIALASYYGVVTSAYGPPNERRGAASGLAPSPASAPPPPDLLSSNAQGENGVSDNIDEGVILTMSRGGAGWIALAWFLITLSFQLCCPLQYQPPRWHVPNWLMPWLPSAALGLILFSLGALNHGDYWRVAVYFAVIIGVYLLISLPMSYMRHTRMDATNAEELNVIELAFTNGRWQPLRMSVHTSARFKTMSATSSTRRTGSGRPSSLSATPSTPRSASQS